MTETTTIRAKYEFTKDELSKLSQELAHKCAEKNNLEDEKKEISSSYKSKIDGCTATINLLSNKISNGYEIRPFKCEIIYDFDNGIKSFRSIETGEILETAKLTADDYQMKLEENEKQS